MQRHNRYSTVITVTYTCFPYVYFQSVPVGPSVSDDEEEEIDSKVRLLTNANKQSVLYRLSLLLILFQIVYFQSVPSESDHVKEEIDSKVRLLQM